MVITLAMLKAAMPQRGQVEWLAIRTASKIAMQAADEQGFQVTQQDGIVGDRYKKAFGKRQVTLIQQEHIIAMASLLHCEPIDPAILRRNVVVSGFNLLALVDKQFQIGSAVLEYTGICDPCSHMETALGAGGFNAMTGHGGINCRVVKDGVICVGDSVST